MTQFANNQYASIFEPSEDHAALRDLVRNFARTEVEPQAEEFNAGER